MKKRILSMLLTISMLATMISSIPITSFAATNVTRGEWITSLVETFSMAVDEEAVLPDNYFGDITSDMECYDDILLAVEFGVIDLAAGEDFRPDDPATREFAARTLNYCLNFQLEENSEYTYNESADVTYPDDIQVAVNRGWFSLSSGNFLPEQAITQEESAAMLADAGAILDGDVIDETYDSKFEFADGVVVIPKGTDVRISEDYTVTVTDYESGVKTGDVFVAFTGEIPVALVATEVAVDGTITTITSTPEGAENAIVSADSEGVTEIDLENFTVAEAETFSVTDTESNDVQLMSIDPQGIDYDKKSKTLTATKDVKLSSVCAGSISVEISEMKLYHKENAGSGNYEAYITAKTSVTKTISFDFGSYVGLPNKITLGYVNIGGIGNVALEVDISLKGGMSETEEGNVMAGFSYARNDGFRLIKSYQKTSYSFTAEAEVKVGLTLSASIKLALVEGRIWATIGVKGTYKMKDFTQVDGESPFKCETISAYLYANVGVSATINYFIDQKSWSKVQDIYTETNSPARVYYHYEDSELVDACTRGKTDNETYTKYTTKTTSAYFNPSPSYSKGSYTDSTTGTTTTLWTYTTSGNNATITGYKGSATAIAIPSKIDGYTVTAIGSSAFENNTALRSVTMPDAITEIGSSAFYGCTNLKNADLSNNITYISHLAFANCTNLNNITIPKSLEECGFGYNSSYQRGPFVGCDSLSDVNFEEGITRIPKYTFMGCTGLKELTIPDTVTAINGSAFEACKNLNRIILGEGITTIGDQAFYGCTNLKYADLSNNITYIGHLAFANCTNLNNITIPKSLEECGFGYNSSYQRGPFVGCDSLSDVNFEEGITCIPKYTFMGCTGLKELTIPDTVTAINGSAFEACKNLKEIVIPDSVVQIQSSAFSDCISLESVKLSNYLTDLGSYSFEGCLSLTDIIIPDSVKILNRRTFANCTSLENVTLPKYLSKMDSCCFMKCTSIKEIFIPASLSEMSFWSGDDGGPFYLCSALSNVTFEEGITKIVRSLFDGCTGIKEVSLPNTITTMGTSVFNGCSSLEKVTLSNNCNEVPSSTFYNCTNLKEVNLPNNVIKIDSSSFYKCTNLETIVFPETLKEINDSAFYGCTKLNNIVFPEGLNTIGGSAFYECKALSEITIPENVTSVGSSAFQNCDALTKAEIKGSGSIGSKAFYDCDLLESITIGDKVTSIGSNMCYSCDKLTDIKLGKGITTIPDSAFRLCQSLETVTIPRFCTTIAANAFAENTKLTSAYVPASVTSMQNNSFSYPAKMTMYGKAGSYAEEYAASRAMTFSAVNAPITAMQFAESAGTADRNATFILPLEITPEFDTDTITFTSSDTSVATVSGIGAVSTKKYGTATITATAADGKKVATYTLTVSQPVAATGISLNKQSTELYLDGTETLTAAIQPENATDKTVFWSSSDTSVVTVKGGVLQPQRAGEAIVTARTANGFSASCTVKVLNDVRIVTLDAPVQAGIANVSVTTAKVPDGVKVYIAAYNSRNVLTALQCVNLQDNQAEAALPVADAVRVQVFIFGDNLKPLTESRAVRL